MRGRAKKIVGSCEGNAVVIVGRKIGLNVVGNFLFEFQSRQNLGKRILHQIIDHG